MSKEEDILFEKIKVLFPANGFRRNIRPNFLKNDKTGKNLEIDIYFDNLKIGVEYQGGVHFKNIRRYNNDADKIKHYDTIKEDLMLIDNSHSIIQVFPSDLKGNFLDAFKLRVFNTIEFYMRAGKSEYALQRLIGFYAVLKLHFGESEICNKKNRYHYKLKSGKLKLINLDYDLIEYLGRSKKINMLHKLINDIIQTSENEKKMHTLCNECNSKRPPKENNGNG